MHALATRGHHGALKAGTDTGLGSWKCLHAAMTFRSLLEGRVHYPSLLTIQFLWLAAGPVLALAIGIMGGKDTTF